MTALERPRRLVDPVVPADSHGIAALSRFIENESAAQVKPRLVGPSNEQIELPDEVFEVLVQVAEQMRAGNAVSVVPYAMALSTQEAAEMLGISRPTLIRLLEQGELPYDQPNRHRRLKLSDVLQYRERTHRATSERLDALTDEAAAAGMYDASSADYVEALRAARKRKRTR
ncbi:DNA-binding protein [Microbacterium protaetiae]|uniref:DNA-binding protein n=1 Tax=Microbacterium protaetiae TaxID=2509458 RepID=A0A4P6EHF0_9MICO|nr:helix-turn-helix domain-containing protein [Microbacterium protaetiae]QAY59537.1 DNA-binding protein [Microbacterium protaetiae]